MPAGLQVWDGGGTSVFDSANALGRIIATVSATGSNGNYSVSSSIANNIGACVMDVTSRGRIPTIGISGRTVSWNYGSASGVTYPKANVTIAILGY